MDKMWKEMKQMQREMDQLFNHFWRTPHLLSGKGTRELATWSPAATDIKETDDKVIATFDIPGVDKKEIELNVDDQSITVKAEKKAEIKEEGKGYFRHERSYSGFYREFPLPTEVKPEESTAEYKDGVLHVTMPKVLETKGKKGKRLTVK
jgi:HSP20 family protein